MVGGVPTIRVLGPVDAEIDGARVDLGGPRQRAVLALLVIASGRVVSVDKIIDDLWHGEPPPRAIGALQAYISNLRRALEPGREPRAPAAVLVSAAPGYAVRLPVKAVDAWSFENQVLSAAELADRDRYDTLDDALRLWNGSAFAQFAAEPWVAAEAARLQELHLVAREQLVDAAIRVGATAHATAEAERLVVDAPLREEGWRLLALVQYLSGRQADALATLRRARERLADELGVDPGPALQQLERDILNQVVAQLPPIEKVVQVAPTTAAATSVFIGRNTELGALLACAERAQQGHPAVAVISGEPGVGKSAILSRLHEQLSKDGWRVVVGRCPELAGGPPAWAIAEAVRSLASDVDPGEWADRLAPLLTDAPVAVHSEGTSGRFLLHRAVCDWLGTIRDRPLAILLDDMHRADTETVRMLQSILAFRPRARLLLVLAHRDESSSTLDELLGALAPMSPTRIALGGLEIGETNALLTVVAGYPVSARALEAVLERTDGNPFFVTELGRLILSEGEGTALTDVPHGVADVVRRRVARLPEQTVAVLRVASVVGRIVDVDVLITSSGFDEETVLTGLEAGVIDGLLVDDEPGTVRFAHVLIRDAIHAGVSQLRRRAWHAAVSAALAERHPDDASGIAYHAAEAATAANAERAAELCVTAATRAKERFAYDAAAEMYGRALDCLDLARASAQTRAEVACRQLPALVQAGQLDAVPAARARLLELARSSGDPAVVARALVAGTVPSSWPDRPYLVVDHELIAEVDKCLALPWLEPRLRCLLLVTRARESSFSGDPRTAGAASDAVSLARELGDPELLALALVALSEAVHPVVDIEHYRAICTELRSLAERHDLPHYILMSAFKEIAVCVLSHEPQRCEQLADEMLRLTETLQLARAATSAGLIHSGIAHARGDLDSAAALYATPLETMKRGSARDGVTMEVVCRTELAASRGSGLSEMGDQLQFLFDYNPPDSYVLGGLLACALVERGEFERARAAVRLLPPLVEDPLTAVWVAFAGMALAGLGDRDACAEFYPGMARYAGILPGATVGFPMLPMDLVLAQVARTMGRADLAREHLETARRIATTWQNGPWLALVEREAAELGLADGRIS